MSSPRFTSCPPAETLALFAAGEIDPQTRNVVLAHTETCSDCMAAVLSANAHLDEERSARPEPRRSRWWIGVAAAAAITAVIALSPLRRHDDPMGRMVAFAPVAERTVEPRLSGGFPWAPYRGPTRGTGGSANMGQLKFGGAAGPVIERAQHDRSAAAQHAAGVALVLVENPGEAAARLEAVARTSHDAKAWSDLAAARYTAAMQFAEASRFPLALAAADEALLADPRLPEALFNRALILERMGSMAGARRGWERYLEVDATSRWAAEARERLTALPAASH